MPNIFFQKNKKTRKTKKSKSRKTQQKGGNLCVGDMSQYEIDENKIIGKGDSGIVYAVKGNPDLVVKVQEITNDGRRNPEEQSLFELQNELASATIAGEIGVGPRIYHLAICNSHKKNKQKIMWVMDKIKGDTMYNILQTYKYQLYQQGKSRAEREMLSIAKQDELGELVIPLVDTLDNHGITIDDLHGGNLMWGTIRDGPPQLWIIDFGHAIIRPIE